MAIDQALEAALRRDRLIVLIALLAVILLSWAYLLSGAGMGMSALEMTRASLAQGRRGEHAPAGLDSMMMPATWDLGYALVMLFMWWIMMVAMMLPSAAPMILIFTKMSRAQRALGNPFLSAGLFSLAYLSVWAGFSLLAVGLQWLFERLAWLSPVLVSSSSLLGAALLLAAGLYQLTPLKQACLRHCRSPLQFVMGRWRSGRRGAFVMGLEHGAYCVGCCWFLMALLFFGGVMNLYWIAGLALVVLLEKLLPAGHCLGHLLGLVLLAWGGWTLFDAFS